MDPSERSPQEIACTLKQMHELAQEQVTILKQAIEEQKKQKKQSEMSLESFYSGMGQ